MKSAKVTPILKAGNKSDPNNYRPISVLPTLSKIFEKLICFQLKNFIDDHKLLHVEQSGFRKKHSCQNALTKIVDQWLHDMDEGNITGTVFIDSSKAFDLVDHSILIESKH